MSYDRHYNQCFCFVNIEYDLPKIMRLVHKERLFQLIFWEINGFAFTLTPAVYCPQHRLKVVVMSVAPIISISISYSESVVKVCQSGVSTVGETEFCFEDIPLRPNLFVTMSLLQCLAMLSECFCFFLCSFLIYIFFSLTSSSFTILLICSFLCCLLHF